MKSAATGFPKIFEVFQAIRAKFLVLELEGLVIRELQYDVKPKGFGRDGRFKDSLVKFDHEAEAHSGMDRDREFVVRPIAILAIDGFASGFEGDAGFSLGDEEAAGIDGDLAGVDDLEDEMGESAIRGLMAHEDFGVKAFIQSGCDGVVDGESEREGGDDFAEADRGGKVFQGG